MTHPLPPFDRTALLEGLVISAHAAGKAIWDIYQAGFEVTIKADASPVTLADTAAEAIILADLARLAPGIAVVAEEEVAAGRIPTVGRQFFVVDPLDGTKEFVQRRGDFTVNIALIEDGQPSLGIVYAPAKDRMFAGDVTLKTAWTQEVTPDQALSQASARRPLAVRTPPKQGLIAVASKSHNTPQTDAYLALYPIGERVSVGSSLKFCLVAAGEADLYPRLSPTCEWDTGAGHAVLLAAGGKVLALDGSPLVYGKKDFFNPGFLAGGPLDLIAIEA
jgi:3'(2'), 5'-bisphosphate nucleotidase